MVGLHCPRDVPIMLPILHVKLLKLWNRLGKWRMASLDKRFYKNSSKIYEVFGLLSHMESQTEFFVIIVLDPRFQSRLGQEN